MLSATVRQFFLLKYRISLLVSFMFGLALPGSLSKLFPYILFTLSTTCCFIVPWSVWHLTRFP